MRKGDSETARQNEQESERGRMLGRAKRLYTADLSFPFLQDSVGTMFYTTDRHRKGEGGRREKEGEM